MKKRERIITVRKKTWIRVLKINKKGNLYPGKMLLCEKVPLGHRVYLREDKYGIAVECFDLTMMFGKSISEAKMLEFFNQNRYIPYTSGVEVDDYRTKEYKIRRKK